MNPMASSEEKENKKRYFWRMQRAVNEATRLYCTVHECANRMHMYSIACSSSAVH